MIAHSLDEAEIKMFVTQCFMVWPGPKVHVGLGLFD